LCRPNV